MDRIKSKAQRVNLHELMSYEDLDHRNTLISDLAIMAADIMEDITDEDHEILEAEGWVEEAIDVLISSAGAKNPMAGKVAGIAANLWHANYLEG